MRTKHKRTRKGLTGTPLVRQPRPDCKHRWTPWQKTGTFSRTLARICKTCGTVKTMTQSQNGSVHEHQWGDWYLSPGMVRQRRCVSCRKVSVA